METTPLIPGVAVIIGIEPNFFGINLDAQATNLTSKYTGYRLYKYANNIGSTGIGKWSDAPIFRMGEILVNYAEAMFELGQFNQSIADQTINKTRTRGKVDALNIAAFQRIQHAMWLLIRFYGKFAANGI